eukprot:361546-Chlamydomonas_euryale.AAC.4
MGSCVPAIPVTSSHSSRTRTFDEGAWTPCQRAVHRHFDGHPGPQTLHWAAARRALRRVATICVNQAFGPVFELAIRPNGSRPRTIDKTR